MWGINHKTATPDECAQRCIAHKPVGASVLVRLQRLGLVSNPFSFPFLFPTVLFFFSHSLHP